MSAQQLKFILSLSVIVFVLTWGPSIYSVYENYLDSQPVTPEQLHTIIRDTPCAGKALQLALESNDDDSSEPLTLGYANELASECKEKEMLNEFREKQLKALGGINK